MANIQITKKGRRVEKTVRSKWIILRVVTINEELHIAISEDENRDNRIRLHFNKEETLWLKNFVQHPFVPKIDTNE